MLRTLPFTIVPLVLYCSLSMTAAGDGVAASLWLEPIFTFSMISQAQWTALKGDLLLMLGLVCLMIEIIKATRIDTPSIIDHLLSVLVMMLYLILFLVYQPAASSTFVLLGLMALIDVMAGFTVALRSATRDVSIG